MAAVKARMRRKEGLEQAGQELLAVRAEHVRKSMELFKTALQEFVEKHSASIRSNPEFRAQFHKMCAQAGVDPLASRKNLWSKLGLGDFYYELGIQILEVCLAARPISGGLVPVDKMLVAVRRKRARTTRSQEVSEEDVGQAIRKLSALGGGFAMVSIGGQRFVRSVPGELNQDGNAVMAEARQRGFTSEELVRAGLGWDRTRAQAVLEELVHDGLALVDDGDPRQGRLFWFPALSVTMQDAAVSDASPSASSSAPQAP